MPDISNIIGIERKYLVETSNIVRAKPFTCVLLNHVSSL